MKQIPLCLQSVASHCHSSFISLWLFGGVISLSMHGFFMLASSWHPDLSFSICFQLFYTDMHSQLLSIVESQNCWTMEGLELEGNHKDHKVQLPAPHRTKPCDWKCHPGAPCTLDRLSALTTALESLSSDWPQSQWRILFECPVWTSPNAISVYFPCVLLGTTERGLAPSPLLPTSRKM